MMSRKNQRRQNNRATGRYVNRDAGNNNSQHSLIDLINAECENIGPFRDTRRIKYDLNPNRSARLHKSVGKRDGKPYIRYILNIERWVVPGEMLSEEIRYTPAIRKIRGEFYLFVKYGPREHYQNTKQQGASHDKIYLQIVPSENFDSYKFLGESERIRGESPWIWEVEPIRGDSCIAFPFKSAIQDKED